MRAGKAGLGRICTLIISRIYNGLRPKRRARVLRVRNTLLHCCFEVSLLEFRLCLEGCSSVLSY